MLNGSKRVTRSKRVRRLKRVKKVKRLKGKTFKRLKGRLKHV